jgi:2-oxoglutarate ferredoxin oxidoreductase subunit alpha
MPEFINGSDAIVRGAIHAKCNFFAGYPITPATSILLQMAKELPRVDGVAIQGEDEIASMGMCIGAAMTGARVMTATSGPGISLYSENIGFAIMGEVPMVIVNVQRMGPATGAATTVAQGDIQFMQWVTSGGYPTIVLAPSTVAECYTLTMRAFDLAERFRTPVFIATDKEMALAYATVDENELVEQPVRQRTLAPEIDLFIPYKIDESSQVPTMTYYGGPHILRFTTSSHNEKAYLSKNPTDVGKLNQHLYEKVMQHADEIAMVNMDKDEGANTLVISYGITAQSMRAAARIARSQGKKVSTLVVQSLWPVPEKQILKALDGLKRVVVAELNHGQYKREVERLVKGDIEVVGVNRVDGELIKPSQIIEALT